MNDAELAAGVQLILSDVDGVLTDGGIYINSEGVEAKRFNIRDGLGIRLWQRAGFKFGIITARNSRVVQKRAEELGIAIVRQGVDDKWTAAKDVMASLGLETKQVAYIGDDLPDLPVIRRVGLGVAVADAAPEVRDGAKLVTANNGGSGAVRELIEGLLKSRGLWEQVLKPYVA